MSNSVASFFSQLEPDPWRAKVGFSPEVEAVNEKLFGAEASEAAAINDLSDWL